VIIDESKGQAPPRPFRHLYKHFNALDKANRHRVHRLRRSMSGMTRNEIWNEVRDIIASVKRRNFDYVG
jgi:hypothetical protein